MRKVELLAPAGDKDALIAAIQSGADAVYLGGKFSARKYAKNFDDETLQWAVEYAHLRNVRIFVTVNILFHDYEIKELTDYLDYLYLINVDALIIQDIGLISLIQSRYPDFEIHISTQASCTNLEAVKYLESLGVDRVVLARENSLEEIQQITSNTKLDIEVFVHGAMCVCYSGQCLMSSFIGKRSGNRGECAQPCRLKYQLFENNHCIDENYLLSQKDLMTIDYIDQLIESGIYSFKIEGRMKSPEYVRSTISAYRQAIDHYYVSKSFDTKQVKDIMTRVFNRDYTSGHLFTDEYLLDGQFSGNRGVVVGEVVSYNKKFKRVSIKLNSTLNQGDIILFNDYDISKTVNKLYFNNKLVNKGIAKQIIEIDLKEYVATGNVSVTRDYLLSKKLQNELKQLNKQVDIQLYLEAHVGSPLKLNVTYNKIKASCVSDYIVEYALNHPTSESRIIEQLSKTNNTCFNVKNIKIVMDESINIPIKCINNLRRETIELLEKEILKFDRKICSSHFENIVSNISYKNKLIVKVSNIEQFKISLNYNIDYYIIPYTNQISSYLNYIKDIDKIIVNIDRCLSDQQLQSIFNDPLLLRFNNICVNDLGALSLSNGFNVFIGQGLNVFNQLDLSYYNQYPCLLSPEVNFHELGNMNKLQSFVQVYGRIESMLTSYCAITNSINHNQLKHCNRCKNNHYFFIDRIGEKMPIFTDEYCRMHIYNSKILLNDQPDLEEFNRLITFTTENEEDTKVILDRFALGKKQFLDKSKFTYGYLKH